MDDRALVAAMVAGDPRGLEGAYRTYAPRLLAYCQSMLPDRDSAEDAVHDTFVLAGQRAGQLRDPDRLRAWLYAIARSECLRQLRRRSRQAPLEEAGDVATAMADPGAAVHAAQVRDLVWSAAGALNPGDRELLELMVRHGLGGPEIASVLGVSADHAHARMSRVRAQLERALGVLLVARTGAADCPELASLVRGWDGVLNTLLRKRIGRHVDGCETCTQRQRDELRPAALLSSYASLPFLAAPVLVWERINRTSATPTQASAIDRRAGRYDPGGFPPTSPAHGGRRVAAAAAGLGVLLIIGVVAGPPLLAVRDDPDIAAATPGTTSASASEAPTPNRAPITTNPPASPSAEPPAPPPPPPPSPTLTTAVFRVPSPCPKYRFIVTATVQGSTIKSGTMFWSVSGSASVPTQLIRNGDVWRATVSNLVSQKVTWSVRVTTTDNRILSTEPATATSPCS